MQWATPPTRPTTGCNRRACIGERNGKERPRRCGRFFPIQDKVAEGYRAAAASFVNKAGRQRIYSFTSVTCATSIPPPRNPPSQYIR